MKPKAKQITDEFNTKDIPHCVTEVNRQVN